MKSNSLHRANAINAGVKEEVSVIQQFRFKQALCTCNSYRGNYKGH